MAHSYSQTAQDKVSFDRSTLALTVDGVTWTMPGNNTVLAGQGGSGNDTVTFNVIEALRVETPNLYLADVSFAHYLSVYCNELLTSDRNLVFIVGDASRTVTLGAVFATGASHTVDELITALQTAGIFVQA